ncbi:hypothetical protein ELY21_08520 [Legionella sp. km535]|uniref:hypothetical protein n=1 Tax=Legionella sp. km535 TaxID=2498107 RepID=UPI000F8DC97E|nr:hypothetical protein [Legionella sp. km535]RUR18263.1 hypothetical protein ELY21_08520 [Legionella sp. km535]
MSNNERDLQKEIIRQIKDSRWSIKGYFNELFKQLLPSELLQNNRLAVFEELITDNLPEVLSKQFSHDGYVILFYAHKNGTIKHKVEPYSIRSRQQRQSAEQGYRQRSDHEIFLSTICKT